MKLQVSIFENQEVSGMGKIDSLATFYKLANCVTLYRVNKDENVHRFALSAIREELLEREREIERERVRKTVRQKSVT